MITDKTDFFLDTAAKIKILRMSPPAARKGGRKVDSVEALVTALQNEAKVI